MTDSALVVGGSSDIGRACAVELARRGHDVVLWGRDSDRLEASRRAVEQAGAAAQVDTPDLLDPAAVAAAVERAATLGPLRVVVHAAGVFDWAVADEADPRTVREVLDVTLTSAAVLTPLVLPHLLRSAPSALVFVGSGASRQVYARNAAYVAAKHGLAGLAGATFLDVRDRGVKVSLVSPGLVAAGAGALSPAGQQRPHVLLQPEDVAAAVGFVVGFPDRGCPTEITLLPQRTP